MDDANETMSKSGRIFAVVRTIFIYLLSACIVLAALLFAADKSPRKSLFGFRYYTVLTPSMEPELSVGDLVIVRLANAEEVEEGDIITFNPSEDSEAYLTHRVTQKLENYQGTGVTCFRTKGDANETEDGFVLDSSRLIGKVSFHIPKLGYLIRFVQLRWYFVIPLVLLLIVFFELLKIYFKAGDEQEPQPEAPDKT
ncbi:MAG: signal peptidase I [Lachnospiraceae bacterium]|nr:signal peptidase I [Lachnospiraceae bacterium]